MAIIKPTDVTPERPVILVLYGVAGAGKTSVATTAENPLLIDTDRGYDRAVQRCEATLVANSWHDIEAEMETMKSYKTIIVDTAKACLDDYLATYAVEQNYNLKTNSLKRFGQMADDFKAFVNRLRANGSDIIFICHDKETQDGDVIRHAPDCTGQSKDLLIRIADQVGYIFIQNGHRTITFNTLDNYVSKNVGCIPTTEIPDFGTPAFETFMGDIIRKVKQAIASKSDAQAAAQKQLHEAREALAAVKTDKDVENVLALAGALPDLFKRPFFAEMKKALRYDETTKTFHPLASADDEATEAKPDNAAKLEKSKAAAVAEQANAKADLFAGESEKKKKTA